MFDSPWHGLHATAIAVWTMALWGWYGWHRGTTKTSPYIQHWTFACALLVLYYVLLAQGFIAPHGDRKLSFAVELNLSISSAVNILVLVAGVSLILEGRIRISAAMFWTLSVTMLGLSMIVIADESRLYLGKPSMSVDWPVRVTSIMSFCALFWFYLSAMHRLKRASSGLHGFAAVVFIGYGAWQFLFGAFFRPEDEAWKNAIYLVAFGMKMLCIWMVFRITTLPGQPAANKNLSEIVA